MTDSTKPLQYLWWSDLSQKEPEFPGSLVRARCNGFSNGSLQSLEEEAVGMMIPHVSERDVMPMREGRRQDEAEKVPAPVAPLQDEDLPTADEAREGKSWEKRFRSFLRSRRRGSKDGKSTDSSSHRERTAVENYSARIEETGRGRRDTSGRSGIVPAIVSRGQSAPVEEKDFSLDVSTGARRVRSVGSVAAASVPRYQVAGQQRGVPIVAPRQSAAGSIFGSLEQNSRRTDRAGQRNKPLGSRKSQSYNSLDMAMRRGQITASPAGVAPRGFAHGNSHTTVGHAGGAVATMTRTSSAASDIIAVEGADEGGNALDEQLRAAHESRFSTSFSSLPSTFSIGTPPASLDDSAGAGFNGGSLASPSSRELKLAFTEFHNSQRFGIETASPYLGEEPMPSNQQDSFADHPYSFIMELDDPPLLLPDARIIASSAQLGPVSEHETIPARSVLNPLLRPDEWRSGHRYMVAPAVLAISPMALMPCAVPAPNSESSYKASFVDDLHGHGTLGIGYDNADTEIHDSRQVQSILSHLPHAAHVPFLTTALLGTALAARGANQKGLSDSYRWMRCHFVLRQNFLLEYDDITSVGTVPPRGHVHLQHAVIEEKRLPDGIPTIQLSIYERPQSSGVRSVLIRLGSVEERDRWMELLATSAKLSAHDLYSFEEDDSTVLGRGRYAIVRRARRRVLPVIADSGTPRADGGVRDSYECALKIVDKDLFWERVCHGQERADTVVREAAVQASVTAYGADFPSFLRLRNFFETQECVVLELELLDGTDLFRHIETKGVLSEKEAASIIRDVLSCLSTLRSIGVAHRDVKPANIFMCSEEGKSAGVSCKLGDFGMATFVGDDGVVTGRCGTPGYVAPEIFSLGNSTGYANNVDIFSAGVTLYIMLCGYEPFYGESEQELVEANRIARVEYSKSDWKSVSVEGRDLVERMLHKDPSRRITPQTALKHPWITRRTSTQDDINDSESGCKVS